MNLKCLKSDYFHSEFLKRNSQEKVPAFMELPFEI